MSSLDFQRVARRAGASALISDGDVRRRIGQRGHTDQPSRLRWRGDGGHGQDRRHADAAEHGKATRRAPAAPGAARQRRDDPPGVPHDRRLPDVGRRPVRAGDGGERGRVQDGSQHHPRQRSRRRVVRQVAGGGDQRVRERRADRAPRRSTPTAPRPRRRARRPRSRRRSPRPTRSSTPRIASAVATASGSRAATTARARSATRSTAPVFCPRPRTPPGSSRTGRPVPASGSRSTPTPSHAFIVIAGRAFDTADYGGPNIPSGTGPRWRSNPLGNLADGGDYVVRHPPGL